jgi:ppGpp synthetase/RelA/SpoT-type nucleotidyltranferase
MSLDLRHIRSEYKNTHFPRYERLVDVAKPLLANAVATKLKDAAVDGRAKPPSNFVRKAVRKYLEKPEEYADPLARINDGAGLRVIVAHLHDAEEAIGIADGVFDVFDIERTKDRYEPNQLGYLGIHLQARMKPGDVPADRSYLLGLDFEIQIHTKAQNAWSTISHAMTYKPPAGQDSSEVHGKIYRAIALVSLFDEQVAEARTAMMGAPGYRPALMLEALHREFLDWLDEPTDDELSLRVLEVVQHAYSEADADRFPQLIDAYVRANRERLDGIFAYYRDEADEEPLLLFQPEVIAIAERLEAAPAVLTSRWQQSGLPYEYLDELATALGRPLT